MNNYDDVRHVVKFFTVFFTKYFFDVFFQCRFNKEIKPVR